MRIPTRFRLLLLVARVFVRLRLLTEREYENLLYGVIHLGCEPAGGRIWQE